MKTVVGQEVQSLAKNQVVKRKQKTKKVDPMVISPTTTILCGAKMRGAKSTKTQVSQVAPNSDRKSQLIEIAQELWLLKQQGKLLKNKYNGLRNQAMKLMTAGSKCSTRFGTIKFNKQKTKKNHSKVLLCDELARREYSEVEIEEILAASSTTSQTREHIVFSPKRKIKQKR